MCAVAGLAALAVAGCGGGDEDSNTALSYDDYTKQVNDLCRSVNADLEAETGKLTGEAKNDADIVAGLIPTIEDANQSFADLTPPDELKAAADDFAAANEDQLAADRKAADAAKAGDQKAYEAALADLQQIGAETDDRAAALGADECVG